MRWVLLALLLLPFASAQLETKAWSVGPGEYGISVEGTVEAQPGDLVSVDVRIPSNLSSSTPPEEVIAPSFRPEFDPEIPGYYAWFVGGVLVVILALILVPRKSAKVSRVTREVNSFFNQQAKFTERPILDVSSSVRDVADKMVHAERGHAFIGSQVISEKSIFENDNLIGVLKESARSLSRQPRSASGSLFEVGQVLRTNVVNYVAHDGLMFTVTDWVRMAGVFPFAFARSQRVIPVPGVRMVMRPARMVRPDASLAGVIKAMHDDDLIVVMDSEPLGVITRQDALREVVKNRNLEILQAREVMSTSFSAIREDSDVLGLCSLMAEKGFEAMPVLLNGQVVGVVHTRDVFPSVFDFLVRVQNAARDGQIKDSDVKG